MNVSESQSPGLPFAIAVADAEVPDAGWIVLDLARAPWRFGADASDAVVVRASFPQFSDLAPNGAASSLRPLTPARTSEPSQDEAARLVLEGARRIPPADIVRVARTAATDRHGDRASSSGEAAPTGGRVLLLPVPRRSAAKRFERGLVVLAILVGALVGGTFYTALRFANPQKVIVVPDPGTNGRSVVT